jgi:hypothetical protein
MSPARVLPFLKCIEEWVLDKRKSGVYNAEQGQIFQSNEKSQAVGIEARGLVTDEKQFEARSGRIGLYGCTKYNTRTDKQASVM